MNPDNHFTQRNMPNLLDLKFNQTKINEVYHLELEFKSSLQFLIRVLLHLARNVIFILYFIQFFHLH